MSQPKPNIKEWSENDRPREKLINKGRDHLSDAELIGIILGSGSRAESAVDLAKRLLIDNQNDIGKLSKLGVTELTNYNGIGEAKAANLLAALELGRRRQETSVSSSSIQSSSAAFQIVKADFLDLPHEEFWLINLNRANKLISKTMISRGGVSGTVADIKLIFKNALDATSSAIIVCHNHPSGSLKPSQQDIALTKKLKKAGEIMDIPVLDHLIVSDYNYFSFADNQML